MITEEDWLKISPYLMVTRQALNSALEGLPQAVDEARIVSLIERLGKLCTVDYSDCEAQRDIAKFLREMTTPENLYIMSDNLLGFEALSAEEKYKPAVALKVAFCAAQNIARNIFQAKQELNPANFSYVISYAICSQDEAWVQALKKEFEVNIVNDKYCFWFYANYMHSSALLALYSEEKTKLAASKGLQSLSFFRPAAAEGAETQKKAAAEVSQALWQEFENLLEAPWQLLEKTKGKEYLISFFRTGELPLENVHSYFAAFSSQYGAPAISADDFCFLYKIAYSRFWPNIDLKTRFSIGDDLQKALKGLGQRYIATRVRALAKAREEQESDAVCDEQQEFLLQTATLECFAETTDINMRDEKNLTALMHACRKKDIQTIQEILFKYPEVDIDMDDLSVNHKIAFMMLAPINGSAKEVVNAHSYLKMFLVFIEKNGTFPKSKKTLDYLLNYCAWIGDAINAERCLELGADPNSLYLETSSLSRACYNGHIGVVEKLFTQPKLNINQDDYRGDPPIISAMCSEHFDIAERLLENPSCDLRRRSFLFGTPLMAAVHFEKQTLAQKIITQWDRCDLAKEVPTLLLTIQKGQEWQWLFKELLAKGVDVNASCEETIGWLSSGPSWINQEASAEIAPLGARQFYPTIGDKSYILDRPIWVALHCDNEEAIKWLLELGADLKAPSESLLQIDQWFKLLPEKDGRKMFINTIDTPSFTL